jgi:hypothetical protein
MWRLMTGIAFLAIVCRFGPSCMRHPSPRTCLAPLMLAYLMSSGGECLQIICVGLARSKFKLFGTLTGLVLLAAIGAAAESRWADLQSRRLFHQSEAHRFRLSAEGEYGRMFSCTLEHCVVAEIPQASSPEQRAEMRRLADYHAQMAVYYGSRW